MMGHRTEIIDKKADPCRLRGQNWRTRVRVKARFFHHRGAEAQRIPAVVGFMHGVAQAPSVLRTIGWPVKRRAFSGGLW
jgi:hypothetical protein